MPRRLASCCPTSAFFWGSQEQTVKPGLKPGENCATQLGCSMTSLLHRENTKVVSQDTSPFNISAKGSGFRHKRFPSYLGKALH